MNADVAIRTADDSDWPVVQSLLEENGLPLEGAQQHLAS
jgi:hypothetical protein